MQDITAKKISPTKKWYLLPLVLFLIGPLIGAYLLFSTLLAAVHTVNFYVPGSSKIFITQPGEYTLWVKTTTPRTKQDLVNDLNGTSLLFTEAATRQSFQLTTKVGWNDEKDKVSHFSLGSVRFPHSGTYFVNARSASQTIYPVYLRQPSLLKIMWALAISLILTALSLVSGVLSTIIILAKRIGARNQMQTNDQNKIPPSSDLPTNQATTWAMACHLSGFAGFIFPLANIIAPLLIWGFKRNDFPYLDEQGKEAINFQISVTIYYIISAVMILIVIGLFLLPLLAAFQIIAMIIASIEVASGKHFRYPLTIRFLQ